MASLLGGIKGGATLKVDESEIRDASTARSAGAVVGASTEKKPEPVSAGATPASARANISKALGETNLEVVHQRRHHPLLRRRNGNSGGGVVSNSNSGGGGRVPRQATK